MQAEFLSIVVVLDYCTAGRVVTLLLCLFQVLSTQDPSLVIAELLTTFFCLHSSVTLGRWLCDRAWQHWSLLPQAIHLCLQKAGITL
jgi:hypothetical protein